MPNWLAIPKTTGMSTMTTGVLFIKADAAPANMKNPMTVGTGRRDT